VSAVQNKLVIEESRNLSTGVVGTVASMGHLNGTNPAESYDMTDDMCEAALASSMAYGYIVKMTS
jgi:hypothetical protein